MEVFEMKEVVENRVKELMNIFNNADFYTKNEFVYPEVRFTVKGKVAGYCYFDKVRNEGYVDFNLDIMKNNWDKFDDTIIHEVAHFCTDIKYGLLYSRSGRRIAHGKEWKRIMCFFGVQEPKRCHSYSTIPARKVRYYRYTCSCGHNHEVAAVTHNRIQKGTRKYKCKDCMSRIYWTGE